MDQSCPPTTRLGGRPQRSQVPSPSEWLPKLQPSDDEIRSAPCQAGDRGFSGMTRPRADTPTREQRAQGLKTPPPPPTASSKRPRTPSPSTTRQRVQMPMATGFHWAEKNPSATPRGSAGRTFQGAGKPTQTLKPAPPKDPPPSFQQKLQPTPPTEPPPGPPRASSRRSNYGRVDPILPVKAAARARAKPRVATKSVRGEGLPPSFPATAHALRSEAPAAPPLPHGLMRYAHAIPLPPTALCAVPAADCDEDRAMEPQDPYVPECSWWECDFELSARLKQASWPPAWKRQRPHQPRLQEAEDAPTDDPTYVVKDDIHPDAEVGSVLRVPLWHLRYSQDTVNFHMEFKTGRSVWETIDQLQRGIVRPSQLGYHPIFPDADGNIWSLGTRRLMALQAWRAWQRAVPFEVECIVRPCIQMWTSHHTMGLSINTFGDPRVAASRHNGHLLWW